jgi:hypothetical protein
VPVDKFTPADLQDYLITHKGNPHEAVVSFDEFKTKTFEERPLQTEERDKEQEKAKEAEAQETKKQAEASTTAMARALSLAVSKWGRKKLW